MVTINPNLRPAPDEAWFLRWHPLETINNAKQQGRKMKTKEFKIQVMEVAERWARRPVNKAELPLTVKQISMGSETITSVHNNLGQLVARR